MRYWPTATKIVFALVLSAALSCLNGCLDQAHDFSDVLMGTTLEVTLSGSPQDQAAKDFRRILATARGWEKKLSYYLPDSEISLVNKRSGRGWSQVSSEVLELIQRSREYGQASGGAFDITVAPLLKKWGFYRQQGRRPSQAEIKALLPLVDYRQILVDKVGSQIKLAKAGMAIDLGGIAKGWAVDGISDLLKKAGVKEALVNLAGNMYGFGPKTWRIGVKDPRDKTKMIAVAKLRDQAISTSGDYERYFILDGRRYCHIFDPRTGWPMENDVISVTVIAPTAAQADVLSTSIFILGPEAGLALAEKYTGVGVLIVTEDEAGRRDYLQNKIWRKVSENLF